MDSVAPAASKQTEVLAAWETFRREKVEPAIERQKYLCWNIRSLWQMAGLPEYAARGMRSDIQKWWSQLGDDFNDLLRSLFGDKADIGDIDKPLGRIFFDVSAHCDTTMLAISGLMQEEGFEGAAEDSVSSVFDQWWSEFIEKVDSLMENYPTSEESVSAWMSQEGGQPWQL